MSAVSACRGMIDVSRYLAEMEGMLGASGDGNAHWRALGILQRWQFDEMLDEASRRRAKDLVSRFARNQLWDR